MNLNTIAYAMPINKPTATHGTARKCVGNCGTTLSKYNPNQYCSPCAPGLRLPRNETAAKMLADAKRDGRMR